MENDNNRLSILIVDDDTDLCVLMWLMLKAKHMVRATHTLKDARSLLSKSTVHVLFLDNSLPDGKGIEFIPEILLLHPTIKIVVISGDSPSHIQSQAIEAGARYFIPKPFPLATLDNVLKTLFKDAA